MCVLSVSVISMQVYHSAWRELCEGMAAAKSLDEVIEVHEAYILSIQRQCFVVPDKLVIYCISFFGCVLLTCTSSFDWYIIMEQMLSIYDGLFCV